MSSAAPGIAELASGDAPTAGPTLTLELPAHEPPLSTLDGAAPTHLPNSRVSQANADFAEPNRAQRSHTAVDLPSLPHIESIASDDDTTTAPLLGPLFGVIAVESSPLLPLASSAAASTASAERASFRRAVGLSSRRSKTRTATKRRGDSLTPGRGDGSSGDGATLSPSVRRHGNCSPAAMLSFNVPPQRGESDPRGRCRSPPCLSLMTDSSQTTPLSGQPRHFTASSAPRSPSLHAEPPPVSPTLLVSSPAGSGIPTPVFTAALVNMSAPCDETGGVGASEPPLCSGIHSPSPPPGLQLRRRGASVEGMVGRLRRRIQSVQLTTVTLQHKDGSDWP